MNFNPFPEITTNRLFLRKIEESDAAIILFLRSDKLETKYIERPENRKTKNKQDAIKFIKELQEYLDKNISISWGISLKNNPEIIGTICLWNFSENKKRAEVGYDLIPEYQSLGVMSEALKSVIHFGFKELKLDSIEAFTHKENENSKKLLEKNDFRCMKKRKDLNNKTNIIFELQKAQR